MNEVSLKVYDSESHTIAASAVGTCVNLALAHEYQPGDRIGMEIREPGAFVEIRFDDSMLPAIVYVDQRAVSFPVPFGEARLVYSPKSFAGEKHLISARLVSPEAALAWRNLALNPYDYPGAEGIFPHAHANVETRGESVFAARNTIDGILAGNSHGEYPYQSWGINQRRDAEITVDLGYLAQVDQILLTTRADFPHDNYWVGATLEFSDGNETRVELGRHSAPQCFDVKVATTSVTVKDLQIADGPSPFPALTQIEIMGTPIIERL